MRKRSPITRFLREYGYALATIFLLCVVSLWLHQRRLPTPKELVETTPYLLLLAIVVWPMVRSMMGDDASELPSSGDRPQESTFRCLVSLFKEWREERRSGKGKVTWREAVLWFRHPDWREREAARLREEKWARRRREEAEFRCRREAKRQAMREKYGPTGNERRAARQREEGTE